MPALSPTMEEGTLTKWLVKEGDAVKSGDIIAEIETDKATIEFETIDEGTVAKLLVADGTEGVKVGQVIAVVAAEGEDASAVDLPETDAPKQETAKAATSNPTPAPGSARAHTAIGHQSDRIRASPLARRLAEAQDIDLTSLKGSGPNGRIIKADVKADTVATPEIKPVAETPKGLDTAPSSVAAPQGIPCETIKLSNMRKTIARRLTESKQQVPHIYLTVDINLDALLKFREELNSGLAARGIKLSVNDLLIKAQAVALMEVPVCNVMFGGDSLISFKRADISVAVSIPGGLITPIITDANTKPVSAIATEMKSLAERARDGKLQPLEYVGGTASLSNMGMFGIKQFEAVINPPQAMILAIGAGEKRPYVVNDSLQIATVMSATGSFDHRAIDGADGAKFMAAFKRLVENPLSMLA